MTAVVLSAYPLSRAYRDRLEADAPFPLTYLTLPQLSRLGPRALLRTLRADSGGHYLLAFEDEASVADPADPSRCCGRRDAETDHRRRSEPRAAFASLSAPPRLIRARGRGHDRRRRRVRSRAARA